MKFTLYMSMALASLNAASAFAPQQSIARPATVVFMSEEEAGGKLVAVSEETVEFTAGLIGGVAGFAIGGPVLGAIGAAAANYVSKSEDDAGEIVGTVSKSAIEVYNYLATLDNKYELLSNAQSSLQGALENVKTQEKVDAETVQKIEDALAATTAKIEEVNDEYDLVGSGMTALTVVGDLVEKTVAKVQELNEEYQLTDKAKEALSTAVDKAKDAAAKA